VSKKYRLVTRSDFDGLVCALLLKSLKLINDVKFVHPNDVQNNKVNVDSGDIVANLPYAPAAHLVFDNHASEALRCRTSQNNYVFSVSAPSTARLLYDYYLPHYPSLSTFASTVDVADKCDSAQFNIEDITHPSGWVLINFLMDARTGLGRFRQFRISNYALMIELVQHCEHCTAEQLLALPDVKERVELYFAHAASAKQQIQQCIRLDDMIGILDLREQDPIYVVNRFVVYVLYPQIKVSIHLLRNYDDIVDTIAVAKSIFNRGAKVDIARLMLAHHGGGHTNTGTCQVPRNTVDKVLQEIIHHIKVAD